MISTRVLSRQEVDDRLDDLAGLRIEVFRDFPYLYDGDRDYEKKYLQPYRDNKDAVIAGAFDGDRLVGAATGMPLVQHTDAFGAAFSNAGIDPQKVFYNAESVLQPDYRGHGIGHVFFDLREAHARGLGFDTVAFCAVVRADDHPLRPHDYTPLDSFWQRRGYAPVNGITANYSWRDIGENAETAKEMQFWMRKL